MYSTVHTEYVAIGIMQSLLYIEIFTLRHGTTDRATGRIILL